MSGVSITIDRPDKIAGTQPDLHDMPWAYRIDVPWNDAPVIGYMRGTRAECEARAKGLAKRLSAHAPTIAKAFTIRRDLPPLTDPLTLSALADKHCRGAK